MDAVVFLIGLITVLVCAVVLTFGGWWAVMVGRPVGNRPRRNEADKVILILSSTGLLLILIIRFAHYLITAV